MARVLFTLLLFTGLLGFGQNDTIVLHNGNMIDGEIILISTGVLTMETSYSDEDFKIEFNKVEEMIIQRKAILVLTGGRRKFGHVRTIEKGKVQFTGDDGAVEFFPLNQIIGLKEVEDNFLKRFKVRFDVGFTITKANNDRQLTGEGVLDYNGQKYLSQGSVNFLSSARDGVAETRRLDAKVNIQRILKKNWFISGSVSFLRNTEQALDGRTTPSLGVGRLPVSTNKLYMAVSTGLTLNIEDFVDDSQNKTSAEVFVDTSFNMYDFKDIDLITGVRLYPSLTESGRFRTDYDLTLKYDLPLDLYIKLGFNVNYDNQPAVAGNEFDYIITSGLGWKFND
ncbi:MAG: DUF481 domain-containing protein [Flavobacteriaceae bacterium]